MRFDTSRNTAFVIAAVLTICLLIPTPSYAYLGPGTGGRTWDLAIERDLSSYRLFLQVRNLTDNT